MARYSDADKMKNAVMEYVNEYGEITEMFITDFNIMLERCSADVRENVRGEWEQVVNGCAILMRCNQCKNTISENDFFEICRKVNHDSKLLNFCPNCGADMRQI